ncbi:MULTISPECIES: LysR family transcriptional regulator [Rhizobium/Agrobacterium group]|uniref:HTH-type transcriptional regulator TtuA n=2 Tax=Rhizobium/Agrobacterium group TaxID=227290 RepID=B9K3I7_ALLAM|nr:MULTISPECIES: LysR family transcriptional regulator [Rhizobium/Agrobacterium group]ACM39435.1 transcriptional regulator LysR family [Allorhizobium ampelinum S4]MCF1436787.1 LysR family transcriptional regulator [Allorhizobium ampelinum]MCF1449043.1 LysR family transcriptional regulator [Allorhizobium ampelinum]MCF1464945.1 LysR family transcriptional regulator [Allorhizobium ampelinum]MCF1474951.1 LysR family transcriptional regulator [Allorhizobium ampelinum]
MELEQLRCFVVVADELHFGRAAQKAGILPASLGRHVRLLEESLGTQLFVRTTRSVNLTQDGVLLLEEVKPILDRLEKLADRFRGASHEHSQFLRIGTIDSAAAGLVPQLLQDFREVSPGTIVQIVEDKTIRLVPKLLAGRLDVILIRPTHGLSRAISVKPLFFETAVVAVSSTNPLAAAGEVTVDALVDEPLIVPDRRSRPHSHDLTMNIFAKAGLRPRIAQVADEKQTIINLVAAGIGSAIVPRWTAKLTVKGLKFLSIRTSDDSRLETLPLAAAWMKGVRDAGRDQLIKLMGDNADRYFEHA